MLERNEVKALLFDTFGTVVDWRSGIANEVDLAFTKYGIAHDPHDFADLWRSLYQPAMEKIRSGNRGFVRLDQIHLENLVSSLETIGVEPAAISDADIYRINSAWHRLPPWPDSVESLSRLRRHFFIAPLSNGNIALLANMAKAAGIPWDCILGAEIVRDYKPNINVYLDTVDVLGLHPRECMMVAAHNDDLEAAAAAGLRTGFILRVGEHGEAQRTDLCAERAWDVIADDMVDFADQMLMPITAAEDVV